VASIQCDAPWICSRPRWYFGDHPIDDHLDRRRPHIGLPERLDDDESRVGKASLEAIEVLTDLGLDSVGRRV